MKPTDWYPSSIKPVREGMYETDLGMRWWHGGYWRIGADARDRLAHPHFWRGVDRNPESVGSPKHDETAKQQNDLK